MVVTLLWGGCISCPQFFMFSKAKSSCCEKDGQCKRPSKSTTGKQCQQMPLSPAGADSVHVDLPVVAIATESVFVDMLPAFQPDWIRLQQFAASHSPPDLNVLHSSLLI
jgi:hypothetical protein